MFLMKVPELLQSLGHNPETSRWDHMEPGRYNPEMFLVFKRLGFRDYFCYAYEVKVDGVSVTYTLRSISRYDYATQH